MELTLRTGNREYFYEKPDTHFPGLKETYIKRYGTNYMLTSPRNAELMIFFRRTCES